MLESKSSQQNFHFSQHSAVVMKSRRSIFASSFLIGISNPKSIIFFMALFPQFIQTGGNHLLQLLLLILTWIVIDAVILSFFVISATKMAKFLKKRHGIDWLKLIVGIIFITLAISLVIESI